MNKVAFYTLGCKVNHYETEAMEELFAKRGYKIVNYEDLADIYIINTCTITNLGDKKSRNFIRRAKRRNRDSIVAAVGCYSQVAPEEVAKIDGVDIILGTTDRNRIVDLCEEAKSQDKRINIVKDIKGYKEFEKLNIKDLKEKTRAYIKIQDGCNQYCSYCIIPYARGTIRSRPFHDIIAESNRLVESGFKEIVLTGIHVTSYGKDLDKIGLMDVIERISQISGIERIRLSSIEPTFIDEEFLKRAINVEELCDHFHLSLQSGSSSVLERMNRRYTADQYKGIADLIREYMPNVGITTDIIVGFPGETKEEFKETYNFLKDIHFSRIHVFKYSPRRGTPASRLENQIPGAIKQARSQSLIKLGESLTNSFNETYLEKTADVLFEESKEGFMEGYTTNYIRVKAKYGEEIRGKIMPVKITRQENDFLIGEIEEF